MLDPDFIFRVSERAEEVASQLHTDIVRRIVQRIMHRLQRGDDYILTAQDKWQLETLQDAGFLKADLEKEIAKATGIQYTEIKKAFEAAGVRSIQWDNGIYQAAGLPALPLKQSPAILAILDRDYRATLAEWRNYTRTTAEAAQTLFIEVCGRAYSQVISGALSYTQAVTEAVERVSRDGVVVTYPSGWRDTIETATLRAVRTGVGQACGEMSEARMDELGWDIVLTSAHLGARMGDGGDNFTNHYGWQGKFYSRSGKDKRFQPLSVCGMGEIQGLCGINCRHSIGPGDGENNPYEGYDSEENRKRYELEQRQRKMERDIWKTKREVTGLKEAVDSADPETRPALEEKYQKKAQRLQKQNKAYKEFCAENGLIPLQDRLKIAGWNRSQAASATAITRKDLDKYTKFLYNEDGSIVVTDNWTGKNKVSLPRRYKPFAVVDTLSRDGKQRDRTIYNSGGLMEIQVHGGDHGHPKQHHYGARGEHIHIVTWPDGKTHADRTTRSANEEERIKHKDILGGETDDG